MRRLENFRDNYHETYRDIRRITVSIRMHGGLRSKSCSLRIVTVTKIANCVSLSFRVTGTLYWTR